MSRCNLTLIVTLLTLWNAFGQDFSTETSQPTPGPPLNFRIANVTDTTIRLKWERPEGKFIIVGYKINVEIMFTYSEGNLKPIEWVFSNNTFHTELSYLYPGTKYSVSICALFMEKCGQVTRTEVETAIGVPDPSPPAAEIVERRGERMVIKIPKAKNFNGPITRYRIVVINEDHQKGFIPELLTSYQEAAKEGLYYYITAEIDPDEVQYDFIIGDKKVRDNYFNAPLPLSKNIKVSIGIVSSHKGITKIRYANTSGVIILNIDDDEMGSGPVMALSVAVAIGVVLLVIGIGVVIMLRRRIGLARRQRLTQSMVLSGPCVEIENTGFIPDEDERIDHYGNLKRQLWNIPRNFLEIEAGSDAGVGSFGRFVRGRVQHQTMPKPTLVQEIADGDLSREEKKTMLGELDLLIKTNGHENIIALIGICELPDVLYVALEDTRHTLKELLLSSRHRDIQNNRFCLIGENKVFQIASAISKGMEYLNSKRILHKKLSCRNIMMADGMTPKISGFGLSHIHQINQKPDYTRWTAQEMFKQTNYTVKSDVWSFGCLMWELLSLGGTLYPQVANKDVPARVARGMRPGQISYIGDELYQMCLDCWQIGLDERPKFSELTRALETFANQNLSGLLSFVYFNGFNYEPHVPELELAS